MQIGPKFDTAQDSPNLTNVGRQNQDTLYRMAFGFDTSSGEVRSLGSGAGANPTAAPTREWQAFAAWREARNWEARIHENIAYRYNLEHASLREKSNKGDPGIDGMSAEDLERWLNRILSKSYPPMLNPQMSESSHGFRPNRSAYQAADKVLGNKVLKKGAAKSPRKR